MQNGKTIKTRKNVEFNVDIFKHLQNVRNNWTYIHESVKIKKIRRNQNMEQEKDLCMKL